jgi:hypothetical protein
MHSYAIQLVFDPVSYLNSAICFEVGAGRALKT